MTLKLTWAEHDLTRETALNRDIQLKNHTYLYGVFTWIMWFFQPHGFSMWPFVVANQTDHTCSSLLWPWGTSWNHCPAYLVPSCQTCTQAGPNQPTNQPRKATNGNDSTAHRWQGMVAQMTYVSQSDSCYCLLVTYLVKNTSECSCWWFDDLMCVFFGIQKGWIQQLKASSVATEYWDRLQGSTCGYKLASLEIVGFIAF